MTTVDLFGAAPRASGRDPFAVAAHTARRVSTGKGMGLVHSCGICGATVAPFGQGVSLRAALAMPATTRAEGLAAQRRAGKWLCARCWRERG